VVRATEPPPRPAVSAAALLVPPPVREKIRLAIIELTRTKQKLGIRAIRSQAGCSQAAVSVVLREHIAGRMPPIYQPWDEARTPSVASAATGGVGVSYPQGSFPARVLAARTDGEREALCAEAASLVAAGELEPAFAREVRGLLAEGRMAADAKRGSEPPPVDPTKYCLVSELALKVGRAVDLVVSDARRDRIAAFAARELELDLDEEKNVDMGGVA